MIIEEKIYISFCRQWIKTDLGKSLLLNYVKPSLTTTGPNSILKLAA